MGNQFKARGFDPKLAPMYAQMLVGMVALTGQWWLDARKPEEGRGRRAPGQPGLERPVRPRGQARPARHHRRSPGLTATSGRQRLEQLQPVAVRVVRRSSAGSPGSRRPTRTATPCAASRVAPRRRGPSTSRPGCALRAGRKSSSTPRCSSTAPAGTSAAARGEGRRLRHLGHAEDVAVEPAQHVLRAARARPAARGAARPGPAPVTPTRSRPAPRRRPGGTAGPCPTAAAGRPAAASARYSARNASRSSASAAPARTGPQPGALDPAHDRVVAGAARAGTSSPTRRPRSPARPAARGTSAARPRPTGPGRRPLERAPPTVEVASSGISGVARARRSCPAPGRRASRRGATRVDPAGAAGRGGPAPTAGWRW